MKIITTKVYLCSGAMLTFLIIAILSNNPIDDQLFACLGIIIGAFGFKSIQSLNNKPEDFHHH